MFFKGLRKKSVLKAIAKANSSRSLIQDQCKIKSIGFIINADEISLTKKDFAKVEKQLGAVIETSILFTKTHKKTNPDQGLVSPKLIGWKGVFKTAELKAFKNANVDILITLANEDNLYISALNALTQAKFKVCISSIYETNNDLTLNLNMFEIELFISELKKYLTILKKL